MPVIDKICVMLASAAVLCACATSPQPHARQVAADATEGKFSLGPFEWYGEAGDGDTIRIGNAFGDIRIREAIAGRVAVSAAIQRFAGDDRDIEVVVDETDDGLQIEVREVELPPAVAAPGTQRGSNRQFDGRIDMALLLPSTADLFAETSDGLLQVKSYAGRATLETVSGRIAASTEAAIVARSQSGEISVSYLGTDWSRDSELVTRTGAVNASVPAGADLTIDAVSRGPLSAQLAVLPDYGRRTLEATLGAGSGRLSIRSESGEVAISQTGVD